MHDFGVFPDAIEPVVGWRAWVVHRDELLGTLHLRSVIQRGCVWPHRHELEAMCLSPGAALRHDDEDVSPNEHCFCGIYAAATPQAVKPYLVGYNGDSLRPGDVWRAFGRVSGWGRVIEGEKGWRAQIAYPHSIVLPARAVGFDPVASHDLELLADELRDAYGVPVVVEIKSIARRLLRR